MAMKRGFTLLELVIYCALLLLVTLAIGALFTLGRSAQQSTLGSYLVSGQADTALRWVRHDLSETALVSIKTYPNAPGCSMVSARNTLDKNENLNVSTYGAPLWTKTVFYSLVIPAGARKGNLVRWEQAIAEKDFLPHMSSIMPDTGTDSVPTYRVLLHDVLAPKTMVSNLGGTKLTSDGYGGFRVEFVRRTNGEDGDESLSPVNPGDPSQPQTPANNTALVDVQLQILSDDSYQPSFYQVDFRVHPHY
jgi:type II secretory pathway pseudopilin PulG